MCVVSCGECVLSRQCHPGNRVDLSARVTGLLCAMFRFIVFLLRSLLRSLTFTDAHELPVAELSVGAPALVQLCASVLTRGSHKAHTPMASKCSTPADGCALCGLQVLTLPPPRPVRRASAVVGSPLAASPAASPAESPPAANGDATGAAGAPAAAPARPRAQAKKDPEYRRACGSSAAAVCGDVRTFSTSCHGCLIVHDPKRSRPQTIMAGRVVLEKAAK